MIRSISRSLTLKWIATLMLTSLVGVALVGLFASRATTTEFDRLRVEQAQTVFTNDVTIYYQNHQSWDGVANWLHTQMSSGNSGNQLPFQVCALADANGTIVVGAGPYKVGDQFSDQHDPDQNGQTTAITVNSQQVGTVISAAPPPGLDPREQGYVDRTNQALLIGAIGAGAAALLIGLLLARHFLRPLAELTKAIRAMRNGELSQQVQIRTHDELGELGQTFNQMSADIHRANQLRKQMTADIAHDLRTPLTVITGYLEGMRDGTLKPTAERFNVMYDETQLLKRLIDDLRTLSLADAGELKLMYQSVQPRELLEQTKQSFDRIAGEQEVTLRLEADENLPTLQIDRERMVQVLANLVSNALRYTPVGGSISLMAQKQADTVQLTVKDTGTGIAEDKLDNVFERFYRTEESRNQTQGESGLGLAIAKSIVEAHHGTIKAQSRLGAGTSIIITLPVKQEAVAQVAQPA